MEMKVTVSQAVHANGMLIKKILSESRLRVCPPDAAEQEAYQLLLLHQRQEAGGGLAAALRGTESAVLALLA
jgi:hypothetical protein